MPDLFTDSYQDFPSIEVHALCPREQAAIFR